MLQQWRRIMGFPSARGERFLACADFGGTRGAGLALSLGRPFAYPRVVRKAYPMIGVVAMNAFLSVVATYAVLRAYDALFRNEPNPALIIWSARIAMFWRLGIGAYVAGMTAIVVYLLARRDLARVTGVTAVLVPIAGAMIALQGALLP
jgi:hypothetical protein